MLEAVGNGGSAVSGTVRAAMPAESAPAVAAGSTGGVSRVALSPRMKSDPVAGVVIAEYLSSTGEKSMQLPSEAVVAYLRSGLTASGSSAHAAEARSTEA